MENPLFAIVCVSFSLVCVHLGKENVSQRRVFSFSLYLSFPIFPPSAMLFFLCLWHVRETFFLRFFSGLITFGFIRSFSPLFHDSWWGWLSRTSLALHFISQQHKLMLLWAMHTHTFSFSLAFFSRKIIFPHFPFFLLFSRMSTEIFCWHFSIFPSIKQLVALSLLLVLIQFSLFPFAPLCRFGFKKIGKNSVASRAHNCH